MATPRSGSIASFDSERRRYPNRLHGRRSPAIVCMRSYEEPPMNDNQNNQPQNAGQPQPNVGDPKPSDQAPVQNAPASNEPGGESKPDGEASK